MKELVAIGVSAGLGSGHAYVLQKNILHIPSDPAQDIDRELLRFEEALGVVIRETELLAARSKRKDHGSTAEIMDAYLALLSDRAVTNGVRELIAASHNAAEAVKIGIGKIVGMFESMEDAYMRERAYDILDIQNRLLEELLGAQTIYRQNIPPGTILVADVLTTSDTAKMDLRHISGIVTVQGGQNSHASIVARSMEIPAVVGADNILEMATDGDEMLVDGQTGEVYICPTPQILKAFDKRRAAFDDERDHLRRYIGKPSTTRDGVPISIGVNIGSAGEVGRALENDADGVGLFRSEFLFRDIDRLPSDNVQFEAYQAVAAAMTPRPVTIRTMDIGSDKEFFHLQDRSEDNPALGCRGIRIYRDHPDLLRTQLRAILRASVHGNLRINFPMISSVAELRIVKNILSKTKQELKKENIPFRDDIPVGTMIEVPSAFMMADILARECDFFSIGTNDLIQYTMAVDRTNAKVAHLYNHYQPAVLRMIAQTVKTARKARIRCSICGEAAGDLLLLPALLGLGVAYFSTTSGMILKSRRLVAGLTLSETRLLARDVLACTTAEEVKKTLDFFARCHEELIDESPDVVYAGR
jgi:phosphotransferase system enzyme I (PtsI)